MKGFGEVVIRARGESLEHVLLFRVACQDDDVCVAGTTVGSDSLAEFYSREVGHYPIGDDQSGAFRCENLAGFVARGRQQGRAGVWLERLLDQLTMDGRIVGD